MDQTCSPRAVKRLLASVSAACSSASSCSAMAGTRRSTKNSCPEPFAATHETGGRPVFRPPREFSSITADGSFPDQPGVRLSRLSREFPDRFVDLE